MLSWWPACPIDSPERKLLGLIAVRCVETVLPLIRGRTHAECESDILTHIAYAHGDASYDEAFYHEHVASCDSQTQGGRLAVVASYDAVAVFRAHPTQASMSAEDAINGIIKAGGAGDLSKAPGAHARALQRCFAIIDAHCPIVARSSSPSLPVEEEVHEYARRIGDPRWEFLAGVAGRIDAQEADVLADDAIDRAPTGADWRYYYQAGRSVDLSKSYCVTVPTVA